MNNLEDLKNMKLQLLNLEKQQETRVSMPELYTNFKAQYPDLHYILEQVLLNETIRTMVHDKYIDDLIEYQAGKTYINKTGLVEWDDFLDKVSGRCQHRTLSYYLHQVQYIMEHKLSGFIDMQYGLKINDLQESITCKINKIHKEQEDIVKMRHIINGTYADGDFSYIVDSDYKEMLIDHYQVMKELKLERRFGAMKTIFEDWIDVYSAHPLISKWRHSGFTFGIMCNNMRFIASNGWDSYVNKVLDKYLDTLKKTSWIP